MSARRKVFPLAAPLFDVGAVTITKKAKALLKAQGMTVNELLDRFRRLDWPIDSDGGEGFGANVAALREGETLFVGWSFGAPILATGRRLQVECLPGKTTIIETESECLYRGDPKHYGPKSELPKKTWGKGIYTPLPVERVTFADTEEAGA